MPLVSVVIPVFNRSYCVLEAVRTAQAQTLKDIEIIVVDDGSKDNTPEIIERFQREEPRVRLVQHLNNRGVSAARNTGIAAARGEYIAFLDSDDLWHPQKLSLQKKLLNEWSEEDAKDVLCFSYFTNRETRRSSVFNIFLEEPPPPNEIVNIDHAVTKEYEFAEIQRRVVTWDLWFGVGSTLFAHRDTLQKNGGFLERTGYGEDTEYVIRHMTRGGLVDVVPKFLMSYRLPQEEKHYPGKDGHFRYMIDTYKSAIRKGWGIKTANEFSATMHFECGLGAATKGLYLKTFWELTQAMMLSPEHVGKRIQLYYEERSRRKVFDANFERRAQPCIIPPHPK